MGSTQPALRSGGQPYASPYCHSQPTNPVNLQGGRRSEPAPKYKLLNRRVFGRLRGRIILPLIPRYSQGGLRCTHGTHFFLCVRSFCIDSDFGDRPPQYPNIGSDRHRPSPCANIGSDRRHPPDAPQRSNRTVGSRQARRHPLGHTQLLPS